MPCFARQLFLWYPTRCKCVLGEVSLIWDAFNYVNNILEFLALESNYFKIYHNMHMCKFKMLSMSLIFSCRNYSNTLCGTVVVYSGFQNILWAILVIGMFSTVWWNIFEFRFMSGGIFSTGKNGVENFLSKILVSKIFHRWLSNIFHCWWIHLSKIFCRKLYVFPNWSCDEKSAFCKVLLESNIL